MRQAASDFVTGPHGDLTPNEMVSEVAGKQAAKNPEAAMAWTAKLPADRIADARVAVLDSWLDIRPEAAATYARNLPAGPEHERAMQTVVQNYFDQSPDHAAAWIKTLPDAERKAVLGKFTGDSPEERDQLKAGMKSLG